MSQSNPTGGNDAKQESRMRRPWATSRVLVVDDADLLLSGLVELLATVGYQPWGARNGCEALRLLESCSFDIVLLDLKLPDFDGYTLCCQIGQRYRIPVVIMSGLNLVETRVNALAAGASAFVGKPFSVQELQDALNESLTQRSSSASGR
jgi:DNA-binding response OmpR family regulator